MKVKAIKTPIVHPNDDLFKILKKTLPKLEENSVIAVTSKIVGLAEGRVVPLDQADKDDLVPEEAEWYLPKQENKYGFCLSIKHHTMIASAGIDHSNVQGNWVLWPSDPQRSVNQIREFLLQEYSLKHVGVILTDSHVFPLRWGVVGTCIAHSGFLALNNYVGKPDIFDQPLQVTRANVAEAIAASAVVCMGEGNEQTPLAIIEDIPFVQFQDDNPNQEELDQLSISLEDDVFASILMKADWKKGKGK